MIHLVLKAKNIKSLIEGVYDGFNHYCKVYNLKPSIIKHEAKRYIQFNDFTIDHINCKNPFYLDSTYLRLFNGFIQKLLYINVLNYWKYKNIILENLQKLTLSISANCNNAIEYLYYLKQQTDKIKTYRNPSLYKSLIRNKAKLIRNLSNFRKFGTIIGKILSTYLYLTPSNILKIKNNSKGKRIIDLITLSKKEFQKKRHIKKRK